MNLESGSGIFAIIALAAFNAGKSSERKALAQMSLTEPKMMTTDTMAA